MNIEKIKKYKIIILLILIICSPFAMIHYKIHLEKNIIQTYQYQQYTLDIYQIGEPDWPFGRTHCQYVLKKDNKTLSKVKFDIADDGCFASANNFHVSWDHYKMKLTVCGSEQVDHYYWEDL